MMNPMIAVIVVNRTGEPHPEISVVRPAECRSRYFPHPPIAGSHARMGRPLPRMW